MTTLRTAEPRIDQAVEILDSAADFRNQEPYLIPIRERHLEQGHPWFPESSPLALAANETLVQQGQYASCDYQRFQVKGGPAGLTYALGPKLLAWLENCLLAYVNPARPRPGPIQVRLQDGKAEIA